MIHAQQIAITSYLTLKQELDLSAREGVTPA